MELLEKTKVYFQKPVVGEIGNPEELAIQQAVDDTGSLAECKHWGYGPGAIVCRHTSLHKDKPTDWGVISHVYDKMPRTGPVSEFKPFEVRWFTGHNYNLQRFGPSELFVINDAVQDSVIEGLEDYNVDTSD